MTTLAELGISHKRIEPHLVAFFTFNLKDRKEILAAIQELVNEIPTELIAGDPYCQIQYISSYPEGYEAEVGFPVKIRIQMCPDPIENHSSDGGPVHSACRVRRRHYPRRSRY